MPDLQTALRSRIVAAVGHSRVHWTIAPQNAAKPYIRMQTVSDLRPQHMNGYDAARVTRVQVDVFGATYAETRSVAEAIITATEQPAMVGGITFGRTKAEGPRDLGEDTETGFIHRASLDLLVEHCPAQGPQE